MDSTRLTRLLVVGVLTGLSNTKWIQEHRAMVNSELILQQKITSINRSNPNCVQEQLTEEQRFGSALVREASVADINYKQLQKLSLCLPNRDESEEIEYLQTARRYTDQQNSKLFWLLVSFSLDFLLLIVTWQAVTGKQERRY